MARQASRRVTSSSPLAPLSVDSNISQRDVAPHKSTHRFLASSPTDEVRKLKIQFPLKIQLTFATRRPNCVVEHRHSVRPKHCRPILVRWPIPQQRQRRRCRSSSQGPWQLQPNVANTGPARMVGIYALTSSVCQRFFGARRTLASSSTCMI